ncbi:hypothetical protein B0H11DRAFT_1394153 [Mycena galericulata]|nr:hypothetical protein B0H11DRAFT_1394153 [Mycena galericulata]
MSHVPNLEYDITKTAGEADLCLLRTGKPSGDVPDSHPIFMKQRSLRTSLDEFEYFTATEGTGLPFSIKHDVREVKDDSSFTVERKRFVWQTKIVEHEIKAELRRSESIESRAPGFFLEQNFRDACRKDDVAPSPVQGSSLLLASPFELKNPRPVAHPILATMNHSKDGSGRLTFWQETGGKSLQLSEEVVRSAMASAILVARAWSICLV